MLSSQAKSADLFRQHVMLNSVGMRVFIAVHSDQVGSVKATPDLSILNFLGSL